MHYFLYCLLPHVAYFRLLPAARCPPPAACCYPVQYPLHILPHNTFRTILPVRCSALPSLREKERESLFYLVHAAVPTAS